VESIASAVRTVMLYISVKRVDSFLFHRLKELIDAYNKNKPKKSAFAAHVLQSGHSIKDAEIVLLHEEKSFRKRFALEHLEKVRQNGNSNYSLVNEIVPSVNGLIEKVYRD